MPCQRQSQVCRLPAAASSSRREEAAPPKRIPALGAGFSPHALASDSRRDPNGLMRGLLAVGADGPAERHCGARAISCSAGSRGPPRHSSITCSYVLSVICGLSPSSSGNSVIDLAGALGAPAVVEGDRLCHEAGRAVAALQAPAKRGLYAAARSHRRPWLVTTTVGSARYRHVTGVGRRAGRAVARDRAC
jgi:hypothetical protein